MRQCIPKAVLCDTWHMTQPRTLFSILLEQPWWISALVGLALFGIAQLAFPPVAPFVALPFVGIALYVGYRQLRTVSPGQVEERLKAVRGLSWDQFSAIVIDAYRRQGYTVAPVNKSAYDFTLTQQGRVTLLQCRRWKVNQFGIGPLEELARAVASEDAYNGICIAAGNVSPNAREFAAGKPLTLVTGSDLAALMGKIK
jgi:restriction system protein